MERVEEFLLESAPLARAAAGRLCRDNPVLGADCSWYHGYWQVLRLLRLVATPEHHAGFLRDAFGRVAPSGSRVSVLICGAIDQCTLAHVLWACGEHGLAAEVTVVDVCETPLYLNRWYADKIGTGIRAIASGILDFETPDRYDAVCTHSFFGQIAPHQRPALVARWRELLKPGGRVVTVNRIRPHGDAARAGFSDGQARALRDTVLAMPADLRERLGIGAADLARGADAYAARRRPYPVRSKEEFGALFENAGFTVEHLDSAPLVRASDARVGGPTTLDGADYARIIARRP